MHGVSRESSRWITGEGDGVEIHEEHEINEIQENEILMGPSEEKDINMLLNSNQIDNDSNDVEVDDSYGKKEKPEENVESVKTSGVCLQFLMHITNKSITICKVPPIEIEN